MNLWRLRRATSGQELSDLMLPILALDRFHLIFQAQFQLLQPDFFQLFIFGEISLLGE